jgi:hypothetical protein
VAGLVVAAVAVGAVVAATAPAPTTMATAVPAAALTLGPCGLVEHADCRVSESARACSTEPSVHVIQPLAVPSMIFNAAHSTVRADLMAARSCVAGQQQHNAGFNLDMCRMHA